MEKNNSINLNGALQFKSMLTKIGIITLSFAVIANFVPAIYLWIAYGIAPSGKEILTIWGLAAATYGVSWVIQPIAYFSVLGSSGSYIAWLAGSVADIRLPSVAMAQKVSGYEAGTHEGDVISTIGIAGSVFVSVTMITIFTLIGTQVLPMLPEFITSSFKYILPSLFGAIYMELSSKNIRCGLMALIFGSLFTIFMASIVPGWALTLIIVFSGILSARIVFKMNKKKEI